MKQLFTLLAFILMMGYQASNAQTVFLNENFQYGAVADTSIVTLTPNWVRHSGTMGPVYLPTSLTYAGYPASGIGGSVSFKYGGSAVNDGDIHRLFSDSVVTTSSIYTSFLMRIDTARTTADYFFHLGQKTLGTIFRARVYPITNGTGYSLSLSKTGTPIVSDATILTLGQTYLLVLKYAYNTAATDDDLVTLYVYSSGVPATEPGTPLVTIGPVGAAVADGVTNIGTVAIRQGPNTPVAVIDGIRVTNSWSSIIPVELASFSAAAIDNSVRLSWTTATETNNLGFNVERKSANGWEKVAFVKGNGTTTSRSDYSYVDKNLSAPKYSYRLKQIDLDGSFNFSKVVEVELNKVLTFELNQNYPNPFNPATTINFTLANSGNVKLTVFNLLGQEVKSVVNGFMEAGTYTVPFNASNLNSGVYLYKIEAGDFVQVRKMTLMK